MTRLLCVVLLLSGCSSVHLSQGIISPYLAPKVKSGVNPLSASFTSIQGQETLYEDPSLLLQVGVGPAFTQPLTGQSPMYGGEVTTKVSWKMAPSVHSFLYSGWGMHYHDTMWTGSDVRYEFSNRIGAGIAYQPTTRLTVDLSYQWMHFSSGATFFGDRTRQFFHLPKASINEGFEGAGLFLGITYQF